MAPTTVHGSRGIWDRDCRAIIELELPCWFTPVTGTSASRYRLMLIIEVKKPEKNAFYGVRFAVWKPVSLRTFRNDKIKQISKELGYLYMYNMDSCEREKVAKHHKIA